MTAVLIVLLLAAGTTWGIALAVLPGRREPEMPPHIPAARQSWRRPVVGRPPWEIENQLDYAPDSTGWKLTVDQVLRGAA